MPARFTGDGKLSEAESAPEEEPASLPEPVVLEFGIAAGALPKLLRCPALSARREGRARSTKAQIVWHDTADGALAQRGLAASLQGGIWRLERLVPGDEIWLPAAPAPVLAEALAPELLGHKVAGPLVPVAAFTGRQRVFAVQMQGGSGRVEVLEGALRGVTQDSPACQVRLAGAPASMAALALELAAHARLLVPAASLAQAALAVAHGGSPAPRYLGGPAVPEGVSLGDAIGLVIGHLADVMLHWAPAVPGAETDEPVHQMRVAVRRLRSALAIFRRVCAGNSFRDLGGELKALAALLGAARDWDVFLMGAGAAVHKAFPADKPVSGLLAAAGRKRAAAYQALGTYLASDAWYRLGLTLAVLPTARPWLEAIDEPMAAAMEAQAAAFAAAALRRRYRRVVAAGVDFDTLSADGLHDVRKAAKQLRYASEFFVPLFGSKQVRRFVDKLVDLQEALGAVNDGAVAAEKMADLAGGDGRAFAIGVVRGYIAASSAPEAANAARSWRKFTHVSPFWD